METIILGLYIGVVSGSDWYHFGNALKHGPLCLVLMARIMVKG